MLNLSICDDEKEIRNEIRKIIEDQILINVYDMQVSLSTAEPEEIVRYARESGRSGVYFLDVELKGKRMDGFELGKEIRRYDTEGTIIYITAFRDLAFKTFEYHVAAMDYIVKGDPQEMKHSICVCLKEIADRMKSARTDGGTKYYTVRIMDVVRHIPADEIYYFETSEKAHRVVLYAKQERIEFPGNLNEIGEGLGDEFLRIHRSYLINRKQIREIDLKKNIIGMNNGRDCLLARNMKSRLLKLLTE